jgi:hypothetical protein
MTYKETMRRVAGFRRIEIHFATVEAQFSHQYADIMDQLQESSATGAKSLKPKEFKWYLVYDYKREYDPPNVTDVEDFVRLLSQNESGLMCSGERWQGYEKFAITPLKILEVYRERARAVCAARLAEQAVTAGDGGVRIDEPAPVVTVDTGLRDIYDTFDAWTKSRKGDKRLVLIARTVLQQLIQSVEE